MDMYVRADHSSDSSDKTEFLSFESSTHVCIFSASGVLEWCWRSFAINPHQIVGIITC